MNSKKLALVALLTSSLGAFGCGDDSAPVDCTTGTTYQYVISTLTVPTSLSPDDVAGFDLDGFAGGSDEGCGRDDYTNALFTDVDNQLATLRPAIEGFVAGIDINGEMASSIQNGELVLLMEVTGVDDLVDDACVGVNVYTGSILEEGVAPEPGVNGIGLAGGQTFLTRSQTADVTVEDAIIDAGELHFQASEFPLDIITDDLTLSLNLANAKVRGDLTETTMELGMIGGAMTLNAVLDAVVETVARIPDLGVPINPSVIEGILNGLLDVSPDEAGICQSLSIGVGFTAVDATFQPARNIPQ